MRVDVLGKKLFYLRGAFDDEDADGGLYKQELHVATINKKRLLYNDNTRLLPSAVAVVFGVSDDFCPRWKLDVRNADL